MNSPIGLIQPLLRLILLLLVCVAGTPSSAQFQTGRYTLTAAEKTSLTEGRDHLQQAMDALKEQSSKTGKPSADPLLDAEIFLSAVDLSLRQDLFFSNRV
jgi:hypothetical protein